MENIKVKQKKKQVWGGNYDGICFEINHWVSEPNSIEPEEKHHWTYYVYLHINRIPEEYKPNSFWLKGRKDGRHVHYDYYRHHVIGNIDFHGGITWYSKESGFDGAERMIKIGCDYQHYWDEGFEYRLESVLQDVKTTIESFKEKIPNYKYWCCGNGKLYDKNAGLIKDGSFYSYEYWSNNEWFKKWSSEQGAQASVATEAK